MHKIANNNTSHIKVFFFSCTCCNLLLFVCLEVVQVFILQYEVPSLPALHIAPSLAQPTCTRIEISWWLIQYLLGIASSFHPSSSLLPSLFRNTFLVFIAIPFSQYEATFHNLLTIFSTSIHISISAYFYCSLHMCLSLSLSLSLSLNLYLYLCLPASLSLFLSISRYLDDTFVECPGGHVLHRVPLPFPAILSELRRESIVWVIEEDVFQVPHSMFTADLLRNSTYN